MNRELRQWRRLVSRDRSSIADEAAAFRAEAGHLRVEISEVREEITETMTDLHAWGEFLRETTATCLAQQKEKEK